MAIVSIKVMPRARDCSVSVSKYVAEAVNVLKSHGIEPMITPDTTVFRLERLDAIGYIVEDIHNRLRELGAVRILTFIMIDDRVDKPSREPEDLVKSVERELERI